MQDDALLATHTPREAFKFSAMLRLSDDVTNIDARVTELLGLLGLTECADVMIGGNNIHKSL